MTKIILTPNTRLSFFLSANKEITAQVYPIYTWVEILWRSLPCKQHAKLRYISDFTRQLIWENIIATSEAGNKVCKLTSISKSAIKAYDYCQEWQISNTELQAHSNDNIDAHAFSQWSQEYVAILARNHWQDYFCILDQVILAINNNFLKLPVAISFVAFSEITPKYHELLAALKTQGVQISFELPASQTCAPCFQVAAGDQEQELFLAANWAKLQLEAGKTRVAVIVPNLAVVRDSVVAEFAKIFPKTAYNVAAPVPLGKYAVIALALAILQLSNKTIDFSLISYILRSPYIKLAQTNNIVLVAFELFLRGFKKVDFSWAEFISKIDAFVSSSAEGNVAKLLEFKQFFVILAQYKTKTLFLSEWRGLLATLLSIMGWPGGRALIDEERQLVVRWELLLGELADLDFVVGKVSLAQALHILQKLALSTLFLPANALDAKVQILGLLEALGMVFDGIWVTGFNDIFWPKEPEPTPFIPLALQLTKNLPRSSVTRELTVAKKVTNILKSAAQGEAIFSYAEFIDDVHGRASLLIADLPKKQFSCNNKQIVDVTNNSLDAIVDDVGQPLGDMEGLSQGVRILQLQAHCPFRAYAESRLKAKKLDNPLINVTKAERGEIVHHILANFWRKIKNSSELRTLSDAEIQEILAELITLSLDFWQKKQDKDLSACYVALEKQRLLKLLTAWLAVEKTRDDFAVLQIEHTSVFQVGPLNFKFRVDRIDQLANNTLLLIDYKTTKNMEMQHWFGDRIIEPQLPLYVAFANVTFSAAAIAIITPSEQQYKGIASEVSIMPHVLAITAVNYKHKLDAWDAQMAHWRQSLTKLAVQFSQGIATVDPKDFNLSCRYCKLGPICRINVD